MTDLKEAFIAYEATHEAALAKKDKYIAALEKLVDDLRTELEEYKQLSGTHK